MADPRYVSLKPKLDQSVSQPRFLARASAEKRDGQITPTPTQAVLAELIHLLPGARCLEIGTFFADTTRAISEAAALAGEGAHVTTIDPFGGHRVPDIMARWPEALQKVTTFLDQNSMSFFLDIELSRPASGREAPFSLIFIDGHHSYDYAFFDLLRGASYLRPGGAIVMDNIEQSGPAEAMRSFLVRNRHWHFYTVPGYSPPEERPEFMVGASSAVLLAPDGVEIGSLPYKTNLHDIGQTQIRSVTLPVLNSHLAGRLQATGNLHAFPPDYHVTGSGLVFHVATVDRPVSVQGGTVAVEFDPPLEIRPSIADPMVHLELELRFDANDGVTDHVLLDPDRQIALL